MILKGQRKGRFIYFQVTELKAFERVNICKAKNVHRTKMSEPIGWQIGENEGYKMNLSLRFIFCKAKVWKEERHHKTTKKNKKAVLSKQERESIFRPQISLKAQAMRRISLYCC